MLLPYMKWLSPPEKPHWNLENSNKESCSETQPWMSTWEAPLKLGKLQQRALQWKPNTYTSARSLELPINEGLVLIGREMKILTSKTWTLHIHCKLDMQSATLQQCIDCHPPTMHASTDLFASIAMPDNLRHTITYLWNFINKTHSTAWHSNKFSIISLLENWKK